MATQKKTTAVPDKTRNESLAEHPYAALVRLPCELSVVERARVYADMATILSRGGELRDNDPVTITIAADMLAFLREHVAKDSAEAFDDATRGDSIKGAADFAVAYWEALGE